LSEDKKIEEIVEKNENDPTYFNVEVENEDNIYDKLVPEAKEEQRAREELAN